MPRTCCIQWCPPSGKQIVFEWFNSPFSTPANREAIYVINTDGSGLSRLTPWAENDGDNPDWSPERQVDPLPLPRRRLESPGADLPYPPRRDRPEENHALQERDTRRRVVVLTDGKSIVFAKGPDGSSLHVYVMRLNGSHVRRVTRSKLWDSAPDWGPR